MKRGNFQHGTSFWSTYKRGKVSVNLWQVYAS